MRTRKQDIVDLRDQLASSDVDVRECNALIGQKQGELKAVNSWLSDWQTYFDACPNRQPYGTCDHVQIKKKWYDTYVSPKLNAQKNLGHDIGSLQQRLRDLNQQRGETARTIQDYSTKLAAEQQAYDEQYLLTTTDKSALDAEQARYDERRYTSKADLFAQANRQSSDAIGALLAKLP